MQRTLYFIFSLFLTLTVCAQDKILVLGDSLTEGYGVDPKYSFPSYLQRILDEKKLKYKVINGGVSGSTTASGLNRMNWYLKGKPKVMILALGANDGLRGLKLADSKKNLEEIIKKAKNQKVKVLMAGMQMPPNYGKDYTTSFKKMFENIAKTHNLKFMPLLIEGVAGVKELNIEDGIHPNRKGYQVIAKNVFEYLKDLL